MERDAEGSAPSGHLKLRDKPVRIRAAKGETVNRTKRSLASTDAAA